MHKWSDIGIILAVRPKGERGLLLHTFTQHFGHTVGIVHGGQSKTRIGIFQPGARVQLEYLARIPTHMGIFKGEPATVEGAGYIPNFIRHPLKLAALNAITEILRQCLPEGEAFTDLYTKTERLLAMIAQNGPWAIFYLRWELDLLQAIGYGLQLSFCAIDGSCEDLRYLSPRTGHAVSTKGAGDWATRLFELPACLLGAPIETVDEWLEAFDITGHFIVKALEEQTNRAAELPARGAFIRALTTHQQLPPF